ncbi:MAG TPA: ABC transporter substrate-binding protein [Acidiferrobacteraceae bacterium]|nr:ABC transporter substrate-binding protein [Acidiferrobacteraceae bacterium]
MKRSLSFITGLLVMFAMLAATTAAVEKGPDALVKELYGAWVSKARAQKSELQKDPKKLYLLADEITAPYIDYNRFSRLVLGKHWRNASKTQRSRFEHEFRHHLVRTYATALLTYIDADFKFIPSKYKESDKQVLVKTETRPKGGGPKISVNYILYKKEGAWQAMDVAIEGISIVATLRSIVRSEVQNKSLDAVIEELAAKNREAGL